MNRKSKASRAKQSKRRKAQQGKKFGNLEPLEKRELMSAAPWQLDATTALASGSQQYPADFVGPIPLTAYYSAAIPNASSELSQNAAGNLSSAQPTSSLRSNYAPAPRQDNFQGPELRVNRALADPKNLVVNSEGQLVFNGEPTRLLAYGDYGMLSEGDAFDHEKFFKTLAGHGLNHVRVWLNYHWTDSLSPYEKTGGKYNLNQMNERYFDRLNDFVASAEKHGIVVQLTFFDTVGFKAGTSTNDNRWTNSPYNPANGNSGLSGDGKAAIESLQNAEPSKATWNRVVLPLMQKTVQTVGNYSNVIYEAVNEPLHDGKETASDLKFHENFVTELQRLFDSFNTAGSRIISVNAETKASNANATGKLYRWANNVNSGVDLISFHIHSPSKVNIPHGLNKPLIISNDGDWTQGDPSTAVGKKWIADHLKLTSSKSHQDRIDRTDQFLKSTFGNETVIGKLHFEFLDKGINGNSWLDAKDYQPRAGRVEKDILEALGKYAVSVDVDYDPETKLLKVVGSKRPDNITVDQNSPSEIAVRVNGQLYTTIASRVERIEINGKAGADTLRNNTSLPSTLRGGRGKDVLIGGSGNDTLVGGKKKDTFRGRGGVDSADNKRREDAKGIEQGFNPIGLRSASSGDFDEGDTAAIPASDGSVKDLSVDFNAIEDEGVLGIHVDGQQLLTGCGFGFIGSATGVDDVGNITTCNPGNQGVMRPFDPDRPQYELPHNLQFLQDSDNPTVLHFGGEIGPSPDEFSTVSMPMDANRDIFTHFRHSGSSYWSGTTASQIDGNVGAYADNGLSYTHDLGPINIAAANGNQTWGEIIGKDFTIRVTVTGQTESMGLYFVDHPATRNVEFSFGKVSLGDKENVSGFIQVYRTAPDFYESIRNEEPQNSKPDAQDDSFVVEHNTATTLRLRQNDTDADGDALTVNVLSQPAHGTVTPTPGKPNILLYTPSAGFHGADQFNYQVDDGRGGTDTATVRLTVTAPKNIDPVAGDDNYVVEHNTATTLKVRSNDVDADGDKLSVELLSQPTNGKVTRVAGKRNILLYTPNKGYAGTDQFRYRVSDGKGGSDDAVVKLDVQGRKNAIPDARADNYAVNFNTATTLRVRSNDVDADGDKLSVELLSQPTNGKVTRVAGKPNVLSYTPNQGFAGADQFRYRVSDGNGGSDDAVVKLTVGAPPAWLRVVSGGYEIVTGAGNDNLKLTLVGDSVVAVLNGKSVQLGARSAIRTITAKLGDGNDQIQTKGIVANEVIAYGGTGDDKFYFGAGKQRGYGGRGADQFHSTETRNNDTVDGGKGKDLYFGFLGAEIAAEERR